jgi:hypothetical protein
MVTMYSGMVPWKLAFHVMSYGNRNKANFVKISARQLIIHIGMPKKIVVLVAITFGKFNRMIKFVITGA